MEENKKGFSGSIGSGGFSVGYGKTENKLKEKDLTNAKFNLVLGDGTQTSIDAVKVSASQSKMNTNGTTYQNGRFVDVDVKMEIILE